jgi:thiol-disulfide isomerase/thioredoxin
MKAISLFMLSVTAAWMLSCSANEAKYTITGKNAPQDGVKVYLVDRLIADAIDSTVVADGTFQLKGKAAKDAFLGIQVENFDWLFPLINDGVPMEVDFADSTLSGSALNNKITECDKRNSKAYARINQMVQEFVALPKEEQAAQEEAFVAQYEEAFNEYVDTKLAIIEENKDNLVPVVFIENVAQAAGYEKLNEILESGAPFTKHPFVEDLKAQLKDVMDAEVKAEDAKGAIIGKKFLDLEEADTEGNMHKLSEYVGKGNWVLVDFWASWCGPCKAEMPNVVAAYKQYHSKGFEVVGLSFDREKEPWVEAIVEWQMPWIHLSDLKYWKTVASEVYSVNSIPDNLLIDPEGIVVARGLRGEALARKLTEIYN